MSATMLPSRLRLDAMIRFKHATKIARFLTCSGKSTIPNALGGDMDFIDSIHLGGDDEQRSDRRANDTSSGRDGALCSAEERSPDMPITAQVLKYPSARELAFERGLWELKNRMVRRNIGGAIEPPMARTISPGRASLMNMLLAVVRAMRNRIRPYRAGRLRRRTGYHRFWIPLPTQAPVTLV
jgi:hypothetical protein